MGQVGLRLSSGPTVCMTVTHKAVSYEGDSKADFKAHQYMGAHTASETVPQNGATLAGGGGVGWWYLLILNHHLKSQIDKWCWLIFTVTHHLFVQSSSSLVQFVILCSTPLTF